MSHPLVTIVTPTYNQERFIGECIESVLAQEYSAWEQVVVDDGSTDETREVVSSYRDPRIRLVTLPHRGLGALAETYNAALAASRGTLVAILEGDDAWPSNKLDLQVPLFDDPGVLLSWGPGLRMDERGTATGELSTLHTRAQSVRWSTAHVFHRLVRSNVLAPSLSVMVRRSSLDAIGGFRQTGSSLFTDLPTWLWLTATQEGEVVFLNRILGRYRMHDAQTTRQSGAEMTRQHLEAVLATVSALDTRSLTRVGWSETARRSAVTRGRLATGESLLSSRRFAEARQAFRFALSEADRVTDRLLAMGGLASSVLRVDLVRRAFELRASMKRRLRLE